MFLTVSRRVKGWLAITACLVGLTALARFGLLAADQAVPASTPPAPLRTVPMSEKRLALTFNITWGEAVAPRILETLRTHQVKATFFLAGPWVVAHPDLVSRIREQGHEIGSLGNKNIDLSRYPREVVREELNKAHQAILEAAGSPPRLFRPPVDRQSPQILEEATRLGYAVVLWGTDSQDWAKPGADYVIRRVLGRAHPGDIVLLHADDTSVDAPEALAAIVQGLKARGYQLVTTGELLQGAARPVDAPATVGARLLP